MFDFIRNLFAPRPLLKKDEPELPTVANLTEDFHRLADRLHEVHVVSTSIVGASQAAIAEHTAIIEKHTEEAANALNISNAVRNLVSGKAA